MNKLTVVMYHYVRNILDSRYPDIKGLELDLFIKQLEFFRDNYSFVTMEDVILSKKNGSLLPENAILLTFDDAYSEHFSQVYPILKGFGVQGSFFVPVKAVVEHKLLDVNKIHFILSSVEDINLLIEDIKSDIEVYRDEYSLDDFSSYFSKWAIANRFDIKEVIFVKRMLQHALPEELRNTLSSKYFEKYVGVSERAFAKELYMNESQLKQMVRDGMHVGAHGYDHYWWDKLDSDSLEVEITKSMDFLSSLGCDMSNWTACYPYGSSSGDVVSTLKKHGCELAFTTEVNVANLEQHDSLLLPRLDTNDFPPKSDNYINFTHNK